MYKEHAVHVDLQRFIRRVLVADTTTQTDMNSDVRPTGYMYLGFVFSGHAKAFVGNRLEIDTTRSRYHFSGQVFAKDIRIEFKAPLGHVLFEFSALGAFELLGILGRDAIDRCCEPEKLNSDLSSTFSLASGIGSSSDAETALAAMEGILISLASASNDAPEFLHAALQEIEGTAGTVNLGTLCDSLSVSQRHFIREFTKYIGYSPKRFCRVLQINQALQAMIDDEAKFLAGIANEAGYSDQPHFNRVFRESFLTNPLEFLNSDQQLLRTFLANR